MEKYICIHGHFYQPPRENAWLEEIEMQDSAFPFHDWNERITAECYGPNASARILNGKGKIINIVNNYEKISFNFGPTLLSWMEDHANDVYRKILDADKRSLEIFNGHGSAIAQAYNHIIMPLANEEDKVTQIKWGIRDFESRFNRPPEGMWLSETAVDTRTLEILADHGIIYTILAPNQANKVRPLNSLNANWKDVSGDRIEPREPYLCKLPNGKEICLFFYDGRVSRDVAFNNLLADGKALSERLLQALDKDTDKPQLVSIATDGESYGHHHRYGEMALSFCIDEIEKNENARVINYGAYLELHPPKMEVEIHEDSSWSCVHGVERWRSDCGCSTGGNAGWNQKWREPLRNALDWLREQVIDIYENTMREYNEDVWGVRNDYISVIMDRSEKNVNDFIKRNTGRELKGNEKTRFIRLLEMQRNSLLMYTSCAWFFDEVSGIETTQVMQYANRAIQLAERENDVKLDQHFRKMLRKAPSNYPELKNGEQVYQKYIEPARLTLSRVGMHYAVHSLFTENPEVLTILNYKAESEFFDRIEAGLQKLAIGKTRVRSKITYSEKTYVFAVLYLGQHLLIGAVADKLEDDEFEKMYENLKEAFLNNSIDKVISEMQNYFGTERFSIRQLFKDEQRKVIKQILERDLDMAEDSYKKIYDRNYNLINFMHNANIPLPRILRENLEIVINSQIRNFFTNSTLGSYRLKALTEEVKKWDIYLYEKEINYFASNRMHRQMLKIAADPFNHDLLKRTRRIYGYLEDLDIELDFYRIQNVFYRITKTYYGEMKKRASEAEGDDAKVLKEFQEIARMVNVAVEEIG